jgi:hypothetical protein
MKPVFYKIETKKALLYSCLVVLFIIICSWSSVLDAKEIDESVTFNVQAGGDADIDEENYLLHVPHPHLKKINILVSEKQLTLTAYLTSLETLSHVVHISLHARSYLLTSINAP